MMSCVTLRLTPPPPRVKEALLLVGRAPWTVSIQGMRVGIANEVEKRKEKTFICTLAVKQGIQGRQASVHGRFIPACLWVHFYKREESGGWAWWLMPVTPVLRG